MVTHQEVANIDRRGDGRDQTWIRRVEEWGPPFMPSSLRRRVRLSWRCAHPALGKPTQAHLACPMIKHNCRGEDTEPTSAQENESVGAAGRFKLDEPRTIDVESLHTPYSIDTVRNTTGRGLKDEGN